MGVACSGGAGGVYCVEGVSTGWNGPREAVSRYESAASKEMGRRSKGPCSGVDVPT